MKDWQKNILFIIISLVLFFPLIQQKANIVDIGNLAGEQSISYAPEFSIKKWFDGSYQNSYDKYFDKNIGFRPWFVRAKNQLEYNLFRKANATGVVVGKKGYLFESDYIRAYTGGDFLGDWFWDEKFRRMNLVRDTLKSLGVELALVLEPGKASYYPEYIRKRQLNKALAKTNYKAILKRTDSLLFPILDINDLFVKRKGKTEFSHFPKGGIHWSQSAMIEAVDTLLQFTRQLTLKTIPDMSISEGEVTKELKYTDKDLVEIMNLAIDPPHPAMHYPEFSFEEVPDSSKPRVLTISDSFYFNILNAGITRNAFANEAFWYYSKKIYPETWSKPLNTDMIDVRKEVESMDIVLMMITERFFFKTAWNFIEELYKSYYPDHLLNYLYDYQANILTDYNWFDLVVKDAGYRKISVAEALKDHASYVMWQDEQSGKLKKDAGFFAMKIRKDPNWLSKVKEKALSKGISLDEQIELEARWMESQEKN